ncbi:TonB-dependent receptor [Sphingobium sp. CR28]|uniref:TonB-dependent receptor n=1 Tax=Sphingobium sp. CR28 TaxID=3400272 RepID=UPI003FEFAA2F
MTRIRLCLLASSVLATSPVLAQQVEEQKDEQSTATGGAGAAVAPDVAGMEEEEIVVTGGRERGAVVGDVKPELQYNAGDVRALGVSSVSELLAELGPQVQSAGGGRPVILLEGRRVSSFREIGTIPAEAIQRVDILPEEVALKYGYSATQKVMNIVLRQRFNGFTTEGTGGIGTRGDGISLEGEGGFLGIRRGERINLNVEHTDTAAISEADRGIASRGGDGTDRTLTPATQVTTLTATWAKPITDIWSASINGELTSNQSQALRGIATPGVLIPGGSPYSTGAADSIFYPSTDIPALRRTSSAQTGHVGVSINGSSPGWQWTLVGNYDYGRSRSIAGRPLNLSTYAAAVASGDPLADPSQPLDDAFIAFPSPDQNRNTTNAGDATFIASGSPITLPAGNLTTTIKVGGSFDKLNGTAIRQGLFQTSDISRNVGEGSINIDIPISNDRIPLFGILGRLSLNGNAAVRRISDIGTLRTFGGGFNWNPTKQLSVITQYRDDETAPTAAQLAEPVLTTANFDLFDYSRGQSVRVTAITGGNPGLNEASLRNLRIAGTYRMQTPNITLNVEYNRTWQRGQITALPGATPAVLAAFPERFQRDGGGNLTSVDLRPINIESEDRQQLRWGFNFTKQLRTPQSQINAMREAMQRRFPNGVPGGPGAGQGGRPAGAGGPGGQAAPAGGAGAPPADGAAPPPGGPGAGGAPGGPGGPGGPGAGGGPGGRGGPGGFGGFGGGGGGGGGRLNFAVFHTWVLSDRAVLRDGQPEIDLLNGGTIGASSGGVSRHKIEVQSGFSQAGLGFRLTGNWQSGTRVDGVTGFPSTTLNFGDFMTADLRLFANLGQMPKLVEKVPFLRGSRVSFIVDNVFDQRQRVTDGNGTTPFAYQPFYQDAIGRSFRLSFRKLFFSLPAAFR